MIITINGKPGSGKSSVAKLLAERLHLKYIDIGDLRRGAAKARGMTLEEYNQLGETTDETDRDVDLFQKKIGETEDNLVVCGRTSFHFIPKSIKVFLDVDLRIAAKRIFNDKRIHERNETGTISSVDAIERSLHERMRSDTSRYQKYYRLDVYDLKHYDCILDTSHISIEQTYERIIAYLKSNGILPKT